MKNNGRTPIQPVLLDEACANCGEREADELVWIDDEIVHASSAGRPTDREFNAMLVTTPRDEMFSVEDGHLIRKVVPRRGKPYRHGCPLDAYRELTWAAIDLAADGFTIETLVDQVRNRPRERHDDSEPWASFTNAAVVISFWKERRLLDTRRRRNHVNDGYFFEDAMIEFHALSENG